MSARATKYFIVRRSSGSTTTAHEGGYSSHHANSSYKYTPPPKYEGPPQLCTQSTYEKDSGARIAVQKMLNKDNVLKTKRGAFEIVYSSAWGGILIPVEDPDALEVTTQDIESVKLIEGFPKVPSELWARWTSLAFYFCFGDKKEEPKTENKVSSSDTVKTIGELPDRAAPGSSYMQDSAPSAQDSTTSQFEAIRYTKLSGLFHKHGYKDKKWVLLETLTPEQLAAPTGDTKASWDWADEAYRGFGASNPELEVSCVFLRKADDLSQWRILVPRQNVTKGSVNANFDRLRDIVTGEEVTQFPPVGWVHAGSSHSHNSMQAFFSSTDDASELGVPGLHIVIGNLMKYNTDYKAKASIVLRHNRRIVDIKDVVDTTPNEAAFHRDVLKMINTEAVTPVNSTTPVNQIGPTNPVSPKSSESKSPETNTPSALDKVIDNCAGVDNGVEKAVNDALWGECGGM